MHFKDNFPIVNNNLQYQFNQMTKVNDMHIENILKKYQNRQQKLLEDIQYQNDYIDTARNSQTYFKSGANTPQFSHSLTRKEIYRNLQEQHQRTHKKQHTDRLPSAQITNLSFKQSNSIQIHQYQALLKKLDETEDKLVKSERNYAEMWRKYEKTIKQKGCNQSNTELQLRIVTLQKENNSYKEVLVSKESNIQVLRDKLKQKNQRLIENERLIDDLKKDLTILKAQSERQKDQEGCEAKDRQNMMQRLRGQLEKLQQIIGEKDKQKKKLLWQLQNNYKAHQDELQILKKGYLKVEEEYKQWVQDCKEEKIAVIREYQLKLNQARSSIHQTASLQKIQACFDDQLKKKEQQIGRLTNLSSKQASELKVLRSQMESAQRVKTQLIHKVSSLENTMVLKIQSYKSLEATYNKLSKQYESEQQKYKQMREKYNSVNREFLQLKGKCNTVFQTIQSGKRGGDQDSIELIRVRKELVVCKEQLQRSKNNEFALNHKINEAIKGMKDRMRKLQEEREENITDLLAERLQNARLKEQIKETKQYLKKEYELSIQNTKKELQNQIIATNGKKTSPVSQADPQKQELYLQLRALQRKYQLLMNEIVTVDEVMSLGLKVQRRYQVHKK